MPVMRVGHMRMIVDQRRVLVIVAVRFVGRVAR
jgi:hypothetical protein